MAITLESKALNRALERAYFLSIGDHELPGLWVERSQQLRESPSVGFIAAIGAVLLARATDERIDAFVIQKREGSAGAFSLRGAATALAGRRRELGYDIGSSSDKDPINHGTLVSSTRWDVALDRIDKEHKPFCSLIITWLPDVNRMTCEDATEALAAYLRVRSAVRRGASVDAVPDSLNRAPKLTDLITTLDGFVSADSERGARGMALVAGAYRAANFNARLRSRNDPRRIDVRIERNGTLLIGSEVKQVDVTEGVADTLAEDAASVGAQRCLLAVLRPGRLVSFDRSTAIRRAEIEHGVVLRVISGARELLHEAFSASDIDSEKFCAALPHAFAEALSDVGAAEQALETWAAIAGQWH